MTLHAELTDAAEATALVVGNVTPDAFGDPTPCTEWDVKALLNHVILWTSYSLERRAHGESVAPELVLHGWDLATATGQDYAVADRAAAAALRAVEANAELFRQYNGFADAIPTATDAPVLDRVLGLSGRKLA